MEENSIFPFYIALCLTKNKIRYETCNSNINYMSEQLLLQKIDYNCKRLKNMLRINMALFKGKYSE